MKKRQERKQNISNTPRSSSSSSILISFPFSFFLDNHSSQVHVNDPHPTPQTVRRAPGRPGENGHLPLKPRSPQKPQHLLESDHPEEETFQHRTPSSSFPPPLTQSTIQASNTAKPSLDCQSDPLFGGRISRQPEPISFPFRFVFHGVWCFSLCLISSSQAPFTPLIISSCFPKLPLLSRSSFS